MVGALSSMIWFAYGIDRHDLLQAAPGFITVPVGVFLTVWCLVTAHRSHRRLTGPDVSVEAMADPVTDILSSVPPDLLPLRDLGDTLELPRISA
jgi:hypothetical protein